MRRFADNPFHVLGLPSTCTRAEVEREGQRLLGMMELGLAQGAGYETPVGARLRSAELVRWAMAELRDPAKRLQHEGWAQAPVEGAARVDAPSSEAKGPAPWSGARASTGWGRT